MKFYLGTHRANWLGQVDIPLMVSRRQLAHRRSLPQASAPWFLDSGGFTELSLGGWQVTEAEYVDQVRRIAQGVGQMEWAAPMDWMCEPKVRDQTRFSVEEHQKFTVQNLVALRTLAPDLPFVPVLQGWTLKDYARCWRMYGEAGVDLLSEPLVGLGTVCRRQATTEIEDIILSLQPLRLHGFGVKIDGLRRYGYLMASADSMAWSWWGKFLRLPGCAHKCCANCQRWALEWRAKVLEERPMQMHLARTTRYAGGE